MSKNSNITLKHYILILIALAGFVAIAFISYRSLKDLKKELDTVYFGNIVQANNLMNISKSFENDILISLHEYQSGLMDKKNFMFNIESAQEIINDLWFEYASKYHTKEELGVIKNIQIKIQNSLNQTKLLIWMLQNDRTIAKKEIIKIYKFIKPTITAIDSLISYEFAQANLRKKQANITYQQTLKLLFITIAATVVLMIFVFIPILKNIAKTHKELLLLNEELKNISITDALTGIYNRRYFDLIMPNELSKARRDKKNFVFAMVDIDNFKKYNDTYGHDKGDEALMAVAKELGKDLRRASDYVFRLGGEEFGIILSGIDKEKTKLLLENIRKKIENLKIPHEKNPPKVVTISIGICFVESKNSMSEKEIIKNADELLYRAKEDGRNMIKLD